MPIHPEDKNRYPDNWDEIRSRILHRAQHQCECMGECGLHPARRCTELNNTSAAYAKGKVVLTIAHLDHTPENCDGDNLKAMCQRCHLRYDREHHDESRRRRIRESKERAGQQTIPEALA